MLLVDDRIGSKDLLTLLRQCGAPAELQHLEFGDFAFIGRGIAGADVYIGVELKRFGAGEGRSDVLRSMQSKRFAGHQLIGLQSKDYYDRGWLLTEGIHRASAEGVLEVLVGREWKAMSVAGKYVLLADVQSWILSQTIRGGLGYWHCPTRRDTARFLAVLYHWWTSKDLDEHRSHQAIYLAPPDRASLVEPSTFVKMASCLPNVGWKLAYQIEEHFEGSMQRAVSAPIEEWETIPGIGKIIAKKISETLKK